MDKFAAELKLAHAGFCALFNCRATASVAESDGRAERLAYNQNSPKRCDTPFGLLAGSRSIGVFYSVMRIWTIGHSTRTIDEFISLLKENEINLLVDVRAWPGSTRYPQFNKVTLAESLTAHGIRYEHFHELGGKRKSKRDSRNTAWRNASFRGYADYMETEQFQKGIERLLGVAAETGPTAIMCAEAVWWRCHRSLVADYLKSRGMEVVHILGANKVEPHPYTSAARIVNGELTYSGNSLL